MAKPVLLNHLPQSELKSYEVGFWETAAEGLRVSAQPVPYSVCAQQVRRTNLASASVSPADLSRVAEVMCFLPKFK